MAITRVNAGRLTGTLALVLASAAALAGCGAAKVDTAGGSSPAGSASAAAGSAAACGTVNIAVNPWVGYQADAAVVAYLAKNKLGCTVVKKDLKEEVSWQGFETGQVDAVLENWGHDDLKKTYITDKKVAVEAGPMGAMGIIGWYVPQWMADKYPDITDYKNLNKYASIFKTSESGGVGQLLDGDPSYVTNDAALVKNLNLNYKVVVGGSEAALIKSLQTATDQKKPLLFYFYEPQFALSKLKIARVSLPPYTAGCDAVPAKIACDYPPYVLDKVVSTKFANSGSRAYQLIKNYRLTNDQQNLIASYIAEQNMSDDEAAKKWVDANPDVWKSWLPTG